MTPPQLVESREASDPNAPPPRSNHTTSLHENSVVLFGGHGGARFGKPVFLFFVSVFQVI